MQPKDIKNDKISDKLLQNDIYTASSELKKSAIQIRDSNKQKKMTLPLSQIRKQRAVNNSFNNRRLKTIVKNMAAHGTTITPVDPVYKQINHRRNPVNFPKPNRNSFTSNLTDDMFVLESPSFVVPLLYMKDPKTSLRNFLAEYEKISLEESYEGNKELELLNDKLKSPKSSGIFYQFHLNYLHFV